MVSAVGEFGSLRRRERIPVGSNNRGRPIAPSADRVLGRPGNAGRDHLPGHGRRFAPPAGRSHYGAGCGKGRGVSPAWVFGGRCRARHDGLSPIALKANSLERAWRRCAKCDHEWEARSDTCALRGHGCKRCASAQLGVTRRRPRPGRSLADVKPELMGIWHPTRNADVNPTKVKPQSLTGQICAENRRCSRV